MLRQPERLAYDPWFLISCPLCIQWLDDVELSGIGPYVRQRISPLRRKPAP